MNKNVMSHVNLVGGWLNSYMKNCIIYNVLYCTDGKNSSTSMESLQTLKTSIATDNNKLNDSEASTIM